MASISISRKNDTRYLAKISIDKDEQQKAEGIALKKVAQRKKVAGFRKGKVPEHILKSKFAGEIADETLQITVHEKLPEIASESEYGLYNIVGIENLKVKSSSYAFDLIFDCKPYVKVGKYKNVVINEHQPEINNDDIEKEVTNIRRRFAEVTDKEDKIVEKGNLVNLDMEIWVNDVPHGEPATNQQYILGEDQLDKEVEEQLFSQQRKVDDEFTIKKKISEEELKKFNQGEDEKKITEYDLIVKIKDVKNYKLPEMTEELISQFDKNIKSLEELKSNIKEQLEKTFHKKNMDTEVAAAIDEILKVTEVFFPDKFIDSTMTEYMSEKKISFDSLGDEDKSEFEKSFLDFQKRKILMEHLLSEAIENEEKKTKKNYRESLHDFLEEMYNHDMAHAILHGYDHMAAGKKVEQTISMMLDRSMSDFHQHLLESYFRKQGNMKKGRKIPVYELLMKQ